MKGNHDTDQREAPPSIGLKPEAVPVFPYRIEGPVHGVDGCSKNASNLKSVESLNRSNILKPS